MIAADISIIGITPSCNDVTAIISLLDGRRGVIISSAQRFLPLNISCSIQF